MRRCICSLFRRLQNVPFPSCGWHNSLQKVQYAQVQRCARQIFICMTIVPLHHIITEILLWRGAESRPCDLSHVGGQNPNHQLCRQRGWMGFIALYPSMQYPFIHCKLRRQIRVSTSTPMSNGSNKIATCTPQSLTPILANRYTTSQPR